MSLADDIRRRSVAPSEQGGVRETLFGDMPLGKWGSGEAVGQSPPWDLFATARTQIAEGDIAGAKATWYQVVELPDVEPRHYAQAWSFLRANGEVAPPDQAKRLLGLVLEVALPQGLDLLAAYPDHSARYYNHSGGGVVWERPDASLDEAIDMLHTAARALVDRIGPWVGRRPPPPQTGEIRLNMLTPSGLHFSQGPAASIARDPLCGPVFACGTVLMQQLIASRR